MADTGQVAFDTVDLVPWRLGEFERSLTSVSPATVSAYRRDLAGFVSWAERAGVMEPAAVDRRILRRYLAYLTTRRYARRSIARAASSLRRYFAWLRRTEVIAEDPARTLSAPRGDARLPRVLRSDELTVLLDEPMAAVTLDPEPIRLRDDAVLELLYGSGLRVGELCGAGPVGPGTTDPHRHGVGQGFQAAHGAAVGSRGRGPRRLDPSRPPRPRRERSARRCGQRPSS